MSVPKLPAGGVKTLATRALGRGKLIFAKHGPTLMTGGGIIVVGIGIYMYCRASMKLDGYLDDHDDVMDAIDTALENGSLDEREAAKEKFQERRHFAWEMVKLYGPATTTTLCGFGLILGGHHIIQKRNAALGMAYKALEEGYSDYRRRVREDLGEEYDRKYLYGLREETVETERTTEDGTVVKEKTDILAPGYDRQLHSPYARFFDEFSTAWTRNPEYNLMFLNAQQNYANDKLHAQGHLFLNEVYEMLGLQHTQAGSVVGWVLNKGGDNCVDFGIYDLHDQIKRAFVNGYEPSILLDFNVDGVIYDLI